MAVRNNFSKSNAAKRRSAERLFMNPKQDMSFEKEDEGIFIIKSWAKSLKPEGNLSEFDNLNYKLIKNYLEKKEERIGEEEANFFSNQKDMECELIDLKKEMNDMVKLEIDRIFKEFIYNDYERRFNTNLETVIKAIVGEDRAYYQLSLFRLEKSVSFIIFISSE